MKKLWILLVLLLLPISVMAEAEDSPRYDNYLSEDMKEWLAAEYPGYAVPFSTFLDLEGDAVLLVLSSPQDSFIAIVEEAEDGYQVTTNDMILPQHGYYADHWWIQDKSATGEPYLWYMPKNGDDEMFLCLSKYDDGGWRVDSGHFQSSTNADDFFNFELANQGTALRVSEGGYFNAVYVPVYVDLALPAFDPTTVKAYCAHVSTQMNEPALVPSTMEADALPQGQVIAFPRDREYPVYSGPGTDYAQVEVNGYSAVSTRRWIQVFGQEGDWLLVQYPLPSGTHLFGYITADALPEGVTVPPLSFEAKEGSVQGWATYTPLQGSLDIVINDPTICLQLATLGDELRYIEFTDDNNRKTRCFVKEVDLREDHAGKAIIQTESAPIFVDASGTNQIGTYYGGVELEVLKALGGFVEVRIGKESGFQEGYMRADDLAIGALPMEVPHTLAEVVFLPGEKASEIGYVEADANAKKVNLSTYGPVTLLGDVGGFAHLAFLYSASTHFVTTDSITVRPQPIKGGESITSGTIVLIEDCRTYLRPDKSMPGNTTLFKGTEFQCLSAGDDWYFIWDRELELVTMDYSTFGYLPAEACAFLSEDSVPLPVGILTPTQGHDSRSLQIKQEKSLMNGFGWGTQLILLGETDSWYLVRTPTGRYGYFNKEDITISDKVMYQRQYGSLEYGVTTLTQDTSYYYAPYTHARYESEYKAGTTVTHLANLGDWWSVAVDGSNVFVPTEALREVPQSVPAYDGIYNAFRDVPFWVTLYQYLVGPPDIAFGKEDAWMLIHEDRIPMLLHMAQQGDTWAEVSRVSVLSGEGDWSFNQFAHDMQDGIPWFSISFRLNDVELEMLSTFEQAEADWLLKDIRFQVLEYDEGLKRQVISETIFTPVEGGMTMEMEGETEFVPLDVPLAVAADEYSAKDAFDACMGAWRANP